MIRQSIGVSGALLALACLSFSDTARAQTVTLAATPSALTFTAPGNTITQPQIVHITTSTGSGTVTIQAGPNSPWLQLIAGSYNTPVDFSVAVNTANLNQGSTVGAFNVFYQGNPQIQLTVQVTVQVVGASALTASPSTVTFNGQLGNHSGSPQACPSTNSAGTTCQIAISNTGTALAYAVSKSTTDGHNWITLDRASGTSGTDPINIGVDPSTVTTAGTYTGSVTVGSTTTADSVTIGVTMVVGANATLTAAPTSLSFFYQTGTATPPPQTITLTSNGGFLPFQITQNFPSWLSVSPVSGSASSQTPVTLSVNVLPNGVARGVSNTVMTITPAGGAPIQVPISLTVSPNPFLTLTPSTLSFNGTFGGTNPVPQTVTVGSTGSAQGFNATATSDLGWLKVSPLNGTSGATAGLIQASIDPNVYSTLPVNTYTGTITVTPTNGDNYTVTTQVTLVITAASQIMSAPQALYFSYQTGQAAPQAQVLSLSTQGPPTNFTLTTAVNTCGGANWLTATAQQSPLATPNLITVSVSTGGMTPGTCSGTLKITYGSSGETDVPVTLFVSATASALLSVSVPQGFGVETTTIGASSFVRSIAVSSTDGTSALQYQVGFQSSPCAWLFAAPASGGNTGTAPSPIQVLIQPACITNPGVYQGSVTITSLALPQAEVYNITLIVNSNTTVTVAPLSLDFTQAQNGPAPAAQQLTFTVSGSGAASFIATVSTDVGSWLTVTPSSGSTSNVKTLTVNASSSTLPASTTPYNGSITITLTGSSTTQIKVPVRLTITAPQTITVTPTSLNFTYQVAGSAPAAQQLAISSTGGPVNFTVGTTSSGGWLTTDTPSSTTPATGSKTVAVNVDPTKFPSGTLGGSTLNGSITINAPSISATPTTVQVTVNVVAAPLPQPQTITNSALPNTGFGAIVPGELITIKGANLGPALPSGGTIFKVNAQGGVDSTLAGVQVTFDGTAGTPTFVNGTQINVIVPWEIAGRTTTNVVVIYNGISSAPIPQTVASVSPAIFTLNATGSGQSAAVNLTGPTAGSINGPSGGVPVGGTTIPTQPATVGSFIAIFGNGGGRTTPASVTGSVTPAALYPLAGWTPGSNVVTATIGGVPAVVQYAGAAPTLINGILQVNLQIPSGVSGSNLAVVISINGVPTPGAATVAVQ